MPLTIFWVLERHVYLRVCNFRLKIGGMRMIIFPTNFPMAFDLAIFNLGIYDLILTVFSIFPNFFRECIDLNEAISSFNFLIVP